MERFDRLKLLIGIDNLKMLERKTILIVGCGGVGGYVIEALARSAIGNLILVDYDSVDITNCNRQLIGLSSNIAKDKVSCFKLRINDINPMCNVITYKIRLDSNNINDIFSLPIDFVIDACDDVAAKISIINYCLSNKIKFISSMGTGNRIDPSKLVITTLDKTYNDPLARVVRKKVSDKRLFKKIVVCTSLELPQKNNSKVIGSISFVPGSAGLLIASYVIKKLIEKKEPIYDVS